MARFLGDPHTHPIKATLRFNETSELAKRLVWEIRDVIKVEESYEVAERYLDLARIEGIRESDFELLDCECCGYPFDDRDEDGYCSNCGVRA